MLWSVLAPLFTGGLLTGEAIVGQNQTPPPIDAAKTKRVIDAALKELDENYVFPDVAKKMAESVRQRQANNEYAGVKTGPELAQLLTRHFQEVSKDKHLRVMFNMAPPIVNAGPKMTKEEQKARMTTNAQKANAGYRRVERLAGNVGYLELDNFAHSDFAAGPAAAAMTFLANTDALLIDLRRNGGGSPQGVALLCSYFFDAEKPVLLNTLYWRRGDRTDEFWTVKDLAGPRYVGKDVYVLTSSRTFSGAEECCYNLQCLKRATIIGETTGGGAHPGGTRPIGDNFVMFVPTGRAINPITKTNWEGVGVKPDIAVPADKALDTALERAVEKLLEKAPDEAARRQIRMEVERDRERRNADAAKG
jgi:C-terminal processing protease CtpA/Prc